MDRVAIFVDAGYLYAASSVSISGSRQHRTDVVLDLEATVTKLKETAQAKARNAALLRIYWYDGALHSGLSAEQRTLADMDDVKLRLGVINFAGQQKGVDSLIVTDLIELARNHAISDAILLSGDEDTRIGVLIAQSFGVRVHLLGIAPSRGNQSRQLAQESDTASEWSISDIDELLTLKPGLEVVDPAPQTGRLAVTGAIAADLNTAVSEFSAALTPNDLEIISNLNAGADIPDEIDRRLLTACSQRLGRRLEWDERGYIRNRIKQQANLQATDLPDGN